MGMNPGMYASDKHDYGTPQGLFETLHDRIQFNLDPCASSWNAKCDDYFTESQDGLSQPWHAVSAEVRAFVNPPYGRQIGSWITKIVAEHSKGVDTVALVASRTETNWWQYAFRQARACLFLDRRLSFEYRCHKCDAITIHREWQKPTCENCRSNPAEWKKGTAPFPSCLLFYMRLPWHVSEGVWPPPGLPGVYALPPKERRDYEKE